MFFSSAGFSSARTAAAFSSGRPTITPGKEKPSALAAENSSAAAKCRFAPAKYSAVSSSATLVLRASDIRRPGTAEGISGFAAGAGSSRTIIEGCSSNTSSSASLRRKASSAPLSSRILRMEARISAIESSLFSCSAILFSRINHPLTRTTICPGFPYNISSDDTIQH